MSRSLSTTLLTEIAGPVTTPAYFIEILFASPLHLCTRGPLAWNGTLWQDGDVQVDGLEHDGSKSSQTGALVIGNADLAIGALVLQEGVAERPINVWKFYGDAPEPEDAVQIFAGVGDDSAIDTEARTVTINLVLAGGRTLYAPRTYITRERGFSQLPAPGTLVPWNGENFRLEAGA